MPSGELVNAELRAMGDVLPDVPDHPTEMGETGVGGERGVVDELPGGLGGDGGTPG
jgi:hypothetical protein